MAYKEEELLLSAVLEELTIEQFEKIQDQIERNGAHIFTQNFEDKMYKLFSRNVNEFKAKQDHELVDVKEEINKGRKTILPGRYLLVAILIMLISSISVMAGPLQQKLKEIVYTIYNDHIVFEIDENEEDNKSSDKIVYFRPSYVPDGFEIEEESIADEFQSVFTLWVNGDQIVYYEQSTTKYGEMVLSSEDTVPTDIQIDGISAKLIEESDGFNSIFYEDEGTLFLVAGHVDKDELIKMLSSLEAIDMVAEKKMCIPSYIPENYNLLDEVLNEALENVFMMWIDENENVLYYEQRMMQTGEMALSSDEAMPTNIKIGEYDGKLISEKDGLTSIFYEDENRLFLISGFLEQEELIKILLSIEPVEIKKEQ